MLAYLRHRLAHHLHLHQGHPVSGWSHGLWIGTRCATCGIVFGAQVEDPTSATDLPDTPPTTWTR